MFSIGFVMRLVALLVSCSWFFAVEAAQNLDLANLFMNRAQTAFPSIFLGSPEVKYEKSYVLRKYNNGAILAIADYNVYMSTPMTGNVMKFLGPLERFRCDFDSGIVVGCPVQFEQLEPKPKFHVDTEVTMVIRSLESFSYRFSKKIGLPSAADLKVNWHNQMVVGVILGVLTSPACSSVFIVNAQEQEKEVVVTYRVAAPFVLFQCDDPVAYSSDFATIRQSSKPVRFERITFSR